MEKIYVHIGISLFAIKKLCEKQHRCTDCPFWSFCPTHSFDSPDEWESDTLPNVGVILGLTDGNECDTIKSCSLD